MRSVDFFAKALEHIENGEYEAAKDVFEVLLSEDSKNPSLLYNLGMCYTELGTPKKAIELLEKCIKIDPTVSNVYVALGFAYFKKGELDKAKNYLLKSVDLDPNNPSALKNLGGFFGKEGENETALYYLKKSFSINPNDSVTVYGLGLVYAELDEFEESAKYFKLLIDMDAPEYLKDDAKDHLREIAEKQLKSSGFRFDTTFYMLNILGLFHDMSIDEIQLISSEIAMKGRSGLDINDSSKKYDLNSLKGEFSGLELVCIMYVGFKKIAPGLDMGIDLSNEYDLALRMYESEDVL